MKNENISTKDLTPCVPCVCVYSRRMKIVEPVFSNIRTHKRLDRFTLRGKIKVNIQGLLYCIVDNIGKIAVFGVI